MDVEESMWTLDEDWEECTDSARSLMVSLARPAPTAEEVTWKQGEEQSIALNVTSAMCLSSSMFPGMLAYRCNEWQSSWVTSVHSGSICLCINIRVVGLEIRIYFSKTILGTS